MLSVLFAIALASLVCLISLAAISGLQRSREDIEYSVRVQRRIDHIANTR